ncbi:MAG: sensor histidine kinase [Eubacterium sp.]
MGKNNNKKNNTETKKMTSIVRKLHWSWIGKKIGRNISADLFLLIILFCGWICDQEITRIGKLDYTYKRSFINLGSLRELTYLVKDKSENILLKIQVYDVIRVIGIFLLVVILFQILEICFSYIHEERKIRTILAPIDKIALKADELSKMTFSEDKYQQIEDAISNLQPEESELISFGDSDLQGIEAAMNNLLIRMRDSHRQQARFVNDASHELRTPIAVIQGYVNMLSRWGREDKKVLDESIVAIQHESDHMKHLVEQLLFLARGDSGKTKLTIERVSLNTLMKEVYEESLLIDEEHPYRYRSAKEEITINADAMMLKQAVRILVDNGAKYTKQGDEIILSVGKTEENQVYLQVQDTGIGMAESDVKHMFERFYRADDARNYQGTGLGLSIAKWIVDKHKGHFEILSRTELGTRIRIILPIK